MADGEASTDRDTRGRFAAGNPGGPGGPRVRRSTVLRRAAEHAITEDHIAAMIRKATRMGLEGNLAAMRLVFERTTGRASEAPSECDPIDLDYANLETAQDCNVATKALLEAICKGLIDRETARLLLDAVQVRLRAIEVSEFETRLAELEENTLPIERGRARRAE